jgi:hypothetical protein
VKGVVFIDSEVFLVTDFVNLTIKPAQFFRCGHMSRMCVFIEVSGHVYMNIYIYIIFLTKCFQFILLGGACKSQLYVPV